MQHPKSLVTRSPMLFNQRKLSSTVDSCATATDFLRAHSTLSDIFPTAKNLAAIQEKCSETLPSHFSGCTVLGLNDKKLVIAVPNQSFATRLKQKLPVLQETLVKTGWQIESIRLKVMLARKEEVIPAIEKKPLSPKALDAITALRNQLEKTSGNSALVSALNIMVRRNQK